VKERFLDRCSKTAGNTAGVNGPSSTMSTMTASVWDDDDEITPYQKSGPVWTAVGDYMGE
jgi:hypothetical protein